MVNLDRTLSETTPRLSRRCKHYSIQNKFINPRFSGWKVCFLLYLMCLSGYGVANSTRQAAIASAHPLATQAGFEILQQGGNAFDAAIAVTATLAVVEPTGSGLGGGGFWLLHHANKNIMLDGRERAPLASHANLYLDKNGDIIKGLSINGPLSAGIPGEPAAIAHLARFYGKLPLTVSLAPAIRHAKKGFPVSSHYQNMARFRHNILKKYPASADIFLQNGRVPDKGFLIKQSQLAMTLEKLAKSGHDGFYAGQVAKTLVKEVRQQGGIWTLEDLSSYKVVERSPIISYFKDIKIVSASPPSSGGIVLATLLNILSGFDLNNMDNTQRTHVIVESMRRAYRDRADYLGDPDFIDIPIKKLIHPYYADGLKQSIRLDQATSSLSLPGAKISTKGTDTTHFSVIDQDGNRVAATLSINYPFGSGFVAKGTGVLLNDEMDDFSAKPGTPNVYGLIGGHANAIAGGKRPLSSMTPTFLENESGIGILGTPGGSRIISMVSLAVLDFAENKPPDSWVKVNRFHHQFLPDVIETEPNTFRESEVKQLEKLGHHIKKRSRTYGNMHAILLNKKNQQLSAASDPRGMGQASVQSIIIKPERVD